MDVFALMEEYRVRYGTTKKPMAKWRVFRQCNYRCPYCSVVKHKRFGPADLDPHRLTELVTNFIPENWRIYLTGGELTIDMRFLVIIIRNIAAKGNEIRLISNGSASVGDYVKLEAESGSRLRSIFFTYHPSMISERSLIEKIRELRKHLPSECRLYVRQVILPSPESMRKFMRTKHALEQPDIEVVPLRLLDGNDGGHFHVDYGCQPLSEEVFGSYPDFPNRKDTYCPAGYEYLYINSDLNVYICIPCKDEPEGCLGNLFKGNVKLNSVPKLCTKEFCSCVPGR